MPSVPPEDQQPQAAPWRAVFDAFPDAVIAAGRDGVIRAMNQTACQMLRFEEGQLLGVRLSLLAPLSAGPGHPLAIDWASATPELEARDVLIRRGDGTEMPGDLRVASAPTRLGEAIVFIITDLSERRDIERELVAREQQHRELLDNANDIIYTHDLTGKFTYVNAAGSRTYGYSPDDLADLNIAEIVDPDHLERARESIIRKLQGEERTAPYELLTRSKDGSPVWVEVSTRVLRNADGAPVGVQGIARDVRERRRAEDALRNAMEFHDSVLESVTNSIAAVDLEGRFTLANRRMTELFGYEREELIGRPFTDVVAPESLPDCASRVAAILSGGGDSAPFGLTALTKSGRRVRIELSLRPLVEDGAIVGIVGTAEDVTLRERSAALIDGQRRVLEAIATGGDLPAVLDLLARFVEEQAEELRCSIMLLDAAQGRLFNGAAPSLPESYVQAAEGIPIGPSVGTCGTAAYTRQLTVSTNIAEDERWEGAHELMAAHGIASAFSTPVFDSNGAVLGTFALYASEPRQPADEELQLVEMASHLAGIAIERIRTEQAIEASEERFRRLYGTCTDTIVMVDGDNRILFANSAMESMFGWPPDEIVGHDMSVLQPERLRAAHRAGMERYMASGERRLDWSATQTVGLHRDGHEFQVELAFSDMSLGGERRFGAFIRDITSRQHAEDLLRAQRQLLEMVAIGASMEDVLNSLAKTVETHAPGTRCAVLLVSPDGTELRLAAAPSLPPGITARLDGMRVDPAGMTAGIAAHSGERVLSVLDGDDAWARSLTELRMAGIGACASTPIFSTSGTVLGTVDVYAPTARQAEPAENLVEIATHIAGIAIERKRAEKAVRSRAAELERLYKRLVRAHGDLEDSKARLEEKSEQLERALESEKERARRDQLTGTLNHAAITDVLRGYLEDGRTRSLALAMVDVDGLKAANDTYGHQTGDAVLVMVANGLMRDGVIVGRYGGDEFVAILPGADREAAERYRDDVMEALAQSQLTDADTGARISIVASIGLAIYPEEGDAVEDLIRLSDSAMYALRRQRTAVTGSGMTARSLGGDRAARMVGEIVPFLTSPGELSEKLHLVSQRICAGAGYDAVNFALFGEEAGLPRVSNSFSDASDEVTAQFDANARATAETDPLRELLRRTHRPVLIDDVQASDFVNDDQKRLLAAAGIRSAAVAPMVWQSQVVGALSVASKQPAAFGPRDAQFIGAVATQVTSIVRSSAMVDELQTASGRLLQAHQETVLMLASAAEAHDHTTGRHLQRVRGITEALARELGYNEERAAEVGLAAVLHDIGKIRVPDYVLSSSSTLGDGEWMLMKQHTVWGGQFLDAKPGFELASSVARWHHERWDGSGYPDGLAGEEIPEAAAITSVADSLDAMTNDRPYRAGRPYGDAIEEIKAWSGRQFSPRVVEALVRLYERNAVPYMHEGREAPPETDAAAA